MSNRNLPLWLLVQRKAGSGRHGFGFSHGLPNIHAVPYVRILSKEAVSVAAAVFSNASKTLELYSGGSAVPSIHRWVALNESREDRLVVVCRPPNIRAGGSGKKCSTFVALRRCGGSQIPHSLEFVCGMCPKNVS